MISFGIVTYLYHFLMYIYVYISTYIIHLVQVFPIKVQAFVIMAYLLQDLLCQIKVWADFVLFDIHRESSVDPLRISWMGWYPSACHAINLRCVYYKKNKTSWTFTNHLINYYIYQFLIKMIQYFVFFSSTSYTNAHLIHIRLQFYLSFQ